MSLRLAEGLQRPPQSAGSWETASSGDVAEGSPRGAGAGAAGGGGEGPLGRPAQSPVIWHDALEGTEGALEGTGVALKGTGGVGGWPLLHLRAGRAEADVCAGG
jgi:hypothetical protein